MKRLVCTTGSPKLKDYNYHGPAYTNFPNEGLRRIGSVDIDVSAVTEDRAVSNVKFAIRERLGLKSFTPLAIDKSLLKIVTPKPPHRHIERPVCEHCKTTLTDQGQCPVCDLGETDP